MGHLQIIRDFASPEEGGTRTVRIYTPDAYDADPQRRFGVLFMQDGQNVFAHPESARYDTWMANNAVEALSREGAIDPWIIVGIDHGPDRFGDYSPWDDPVSNVVPAKGQRYARFIDDHLLPFIDAHYRTRPDPRWRALMGASLGGLISLYMHMARPDLYGRVGGVSPSVMWSQALLFAYWKAHPRKFSKIYLDAGETEFIVVDGRALDYGSATRTFYEHLKGLGYEDHELKVVLEPGGQHFEADWQRRLPGAMRWLLG